MKDTLTLPDLSKATPKEAAAQLVAILGKGEAMNFCEEMIDELPGKRAYYEEVKTELKQ